MDGIAELRKSWTAQPAAVRGVVLMIASTFAFSSMHVCVRIVSEELPTFMVVFFRNLFGLMFLIPLLARAGFGQLRTRRIGRHALRGLVNIVSMMLFFGALTITPIAKVTALNFTAPIFTAVLSIVILGERFRMHRWAAIAAGFVGTLIVLRPGLVVVDTGALMVLGAALLWGYTMILIRQLSRTESSLTIVAWMGVFLCAFSIGPALWTWEWPSPRAWGWLLLIGLVGMSAQMLLSTALKMAEPTAVMPFDFLKLVWSALLAFWLFAEIPDRYTLIGAALIFTASLYIAARERRTALQAKA